MPRLLVRENAAYDKHTVVLWGRDNQIPLFHVLRTMLNDQGKRLVHIGMRSGGLDMFAISGQRTIYIIGPDTRDERIPLLAEAIRKIPGAHMEHFRARRLPGPCEDQADLGFTEEGLSSLLERIVAVHAE